MLEPLWGDWGISEAALIPAGTGVVPTAVWRERNEGQGDRKHCEVEEALSRGGGQEVTALQLYLLCCLAAM